MDITSEQRASPSYIFTGPPIRIARDQRSLKARDMLSVIGLLRYSKKVRSDV